MQLAIDTSTSIVSLALAEEGQILAELTWCSRQNHSVELLPELGHLLNLVKVKKEEISQIMVAKGPGSYNGLRVGVSTAKGLAFSLNVPITGISTLEAHAYQYAQTGLLVCSLINAGRGEFAAAFYQQKNHRWSTLKREHLATLESLAQDIQTKTLFCGELEQSAISRLKRSLKENFVLPRKASTLRRAAYLVELGQKRLKAGKGDDPSTLQPLYLRQPHITRPKRKIEWSPNGNMAKSTD